MSDINERLIEVFQGEQDFVTEAYLKGCVFVVLGAAWLTVLTCSAVYHDAELRALRLAVAQYEGTVQP